MCLFTFVGSILNYDRKGHLGEQTRRTSSWCSRATNLRWPLMWILLFSLFGTGCAESFQKLEEDMTMQIANAMFVMTCTTLMFTLIGAFAVLISFFRGRSWSLRSTLELLNQQAVCLFSAAWPCVSALLVTFWGVKVIYPDFGVWTAICCMFCGIDLLHVLWNLAYWKAKKIRTIMCCRRIGRKRCKQSKKHCMRRKHLCCKANIQYACRDRYLDSSFKSKCLIPKPKPQQTSNQSHNPPYPMFRGGGGGAATTARKRKEKQLLDGLQSLLQQFAEQPETQTANATARGKGKGQGKKQSKSKNQSQQRDATSLEYGLLQALQTLTSRAEKKPSELLPRLQTLVEVAHRGLLRPRKKVKPEATAPKAEAETVRSRPATTRPENVSKPSNAKQPASNRWQKRQEWKARAQDWNVKEVLRGPEALCRLLDDAKSPPGPCLCQVKSTDEWTEALHVAFGADFKELTLVMDATSKTEPELGDFRFHGWTLQNALSPGLANEKLVQTQIWIARASPCAPMLLQDAQNAKRPLIKKKQEDFVLRICCDLRFSSTDHHGLILKSPDACFRTWLSHTSSRSRELLLQLGDSWGFQHTKDEKLVRGLLRVKSKDSALQMISGSGKGHNGQVWFIEPARWDLLVENTPRMLWQDQLPNETPFAYAKRLHADAGPYGMGRGTHQLGFRVKPDDSRLKPTPASWRVATVPHAWDLENVTETLKQIGFQDIDILSKQRQRGGSAWIFRALRTDDRDQLQLHFDEENDEPALDLFIVKQAKIKKQGTISPLKPEKNMIFAVPDECSKGKGKGKGKKGKGRVSFAPTTDDSLPTNPIRNPDSIQVSDDDFETKQSDFENMDIDSLQGSKRKPSQTTSPAKKLSPQHKRIRQEALPSGARRVPNPGEGNCLFHALAQAETKPGKIRSHRQLRAFLNAYLRKHQTKFAEFWDHIGPDDKPMAGDFSDYITAIGKDKAWGGYLELAAYAEATNKPVLVVHTKDNVVHSFNASSHNEAVCLIFETQHYELLLTQDCDLQTIWQRAEDGGHTGYRGAAKSSGSKSLHMTDFASLRLTDFASKRKTSCKKSVATDTNVTKASSVRSVKAKTPKKDCVLERHTWTCPLCDKVIETFGKLRTMSSARSRHLSTRHKDVDTKNVARLRRPAEPICHVSYDLPDSATAWRCPWCPARLPFLSAPAKALAVRQHCKTEHPRRKMSKLRKARWTAKDPALLEVRRQANETLKKTCQDRRAANSNGHEIVNLPIIWTQWPRGTAKQRNSWGQKQKATSHRTGDVLTCTKCRALGNLMKFKKPCPENEPTIINGRRKGWWRALVKMGSHNPTLVAKAWCTSVSAINDIYGCNR